MSKHTPGPWIAGQQINPEGKALPMFDIWTNSDKPRYIGEIPKAENARLIAAAPDLLAALKMALEAPDNDRSWEDDAIAAIKKADPFWEDPLVN